MTTMKLSVRAPEISVQIRLKSFAFHQQNRFLMTLNANSEFFCTQRRCEKRKMQPVGRKVMNEWSRKEWSMRVDSLFTFIIDWTISINSMLIYTALSFNSSSYCNDPRVHSLSQFQNRLKTKYFLNLRRGLQPSHTVKLTIICAP